MAERKVSSKTVKIDRKGSFHDDAFFKDSWDSWNDAMKGVVTRWDSKAKPRDITLPSTYRRIRTDNITSNDSQAVSCTDHDDHYKMVVDVKDFKPDEVNVKVVDDKVVVEGKIERKSGNSTSSQHFVRRFGLPSTVDFNRVSSALSRDGVLKITAPKKPQKKGSILKVTAKEEKEIRRPSKEEPSPPLPKGVKGTMLTHGDMDFDRLVEMTQQEMKQLMGDSRVPAAVLSPAPRVYGPGGDKQIEKSTKHDVIRNGNTVTEREEKRWEDKPALGVKREHHSVSEVSKVRGADGTILGDQQRQKYESEAKGGHEEILPDGTKRKVFTTSYATRQVFTSSSQDPKAL